MRVDPRTVSHIAAAVALSGLARDEAATDRAVLMRARLCKADAAEVHRQSAGWLSIASADDARQAVAYIAERSQHVADHMTAGDSS